MPDLSKIVLVVILFSVIAMSLWHLRWCLSRNEEVKYNSWREPLHVPVWPFPSIERTPRAARLVETQSGLEPDADLLPDSTTKRHRSHYTLVALAAGLIMTTANPHWQAVVPRVQRLKSPKLAHIPGAQETAYDPPLFPTLPHSPLCRKPSYGSFGSTTISRRSPKKSSPMMTPYGGQGIGIQGIRISSSFEAAIDTGMSSHYKVPSNHSRTPRIGQPRQLAELVIPKGRVLTPERTTVVHKSDRYNWRPGSIVVAALQRRRRL